PYYEVSWALYPDLAMDLIVPALGRMIDVEIAGWSFFLGSQLLVITGAMALEFSVKRRHEIASVAAILTLYSLPFSLGLVNFEFGTGIALWGIASWIALSRTDNWPLRNGVHAVFVVVLFISHLFALGIYGLTIGLLELKQIFDSRLNAGRALITFSTLTWPVIVILLLMKLSGGTFGEIDNEWSFDWKLVWLVL